MNVLNVDSAADICDLKIVKDVAETQLLVTATGQQHGRKPRDAQTAAQVRQNDRNISPKSQDKSIVSFQQSVSDVSVTNTSNTESSKGSSRAAGFKSVSVASPRKTAVRSAAHNLNDKKSHHVVDADSRSSPCKKPINGCLHNRHLNGISKVKGYDASRISGSSPNDLSACVQTMTVSDQTSTDSFSQSNQRNASRKRTTSGMASVKLVH